MPNLELKVIINAIDNASAKLSTIGKSVTDFGKKTSTVGKNMMRSITLPIVAVGAAALKTASDFDTQMRAANQMMKVSDKVFPSMKKRIQDLAIQTGQSSTDMAKALYGVASAGFRGEEAFKVLETVGKASTAGLANAESVTSALSKTLNIFGLTGDEANQSMDKLFGIVDAGLLNFDQLSQSFPLAATMAGALGVSFDEVGAALATVTKTAGSTSQAATAINATMTALAKPSEMLGSLIEEWGYENAQAAIEAEGFTGVLKRMKDATGGNADQMAQLVPNVEALRALFPLLGDSADDYANALETVSQSTGKTNKLFSDMADGPGFKMKQAWISLKVSMQQFGDALVPIMEIAVKAIQKLTTWFGNLSPKTKKFIAIALAVAAAIGPIVFVVGALITGIGMLISAFVFIMSPIGLFIAAIVALQGALIYLVLKHKVLWENMKLIWTSVKTMFVENLKFIADWIGKQAEKISNIWSSLMGGIKNFTSSGMEAVKNVVQTVVDWIWNKINWVKDKISSVVNMFKNVGSTISSGISSGYSAVTGALEFADGGVVPGPIGQAVPAIVHGGETIIPAGGGSGITVNINGGTYLSEDVAEDIGNMIVNRLKLATTL